MGYEKIGVWAFILGVIIALITGIVAGAVGLETITAGWIVLVLVILGLIVGFLNIGDKEITNFLIAAIALIVVGTATELIRINLVIPYVGSVLQAIVAYIAVFVTPAVLVVSLKAVYNLSKTPV